MSAENDARQVVLPGRTVFSTVLSEKVALVRGGDLFNGWNAQVFADFPRQQIDNLVMTGDR
jgi:hypothetical protein